MARLSSRQARTHRLVRLYLRYHTTRIKRRIRVKNKTMQVLRRAGYTEQEQQLACLPVHVQAPIPSIQLRYTGDSDSDSLSSSLDSDSDSTETTSSSSDDGWSDVLGSDWRGSGCSESSEDSEVSSESDGGDADDEMPELLPLGYPDSDDEDDEESLSSDEGGSSDSPALRDMEGLLHEDHDLDMPRSNAPLRWVRQSVEEMHAQRYEMPRNAFPHGPAFMPHVLTELKNTRPDLFREELRVSPSTFDQLVGTLSDDPVFTNDSRNGQMPIEKQLAIVLFRFGHSGNAAGLQKVANWAGVGKGTVTLVTRRVLTAILHHDFMADAVRMPTPAEKEKAKDWVESHSCKGWRDGWCLVDGTLVPLFDRPYWYGESYFDRKCNYSLNIQIVSL
ncbi:hypothetical protein B0H19DRAFT_1270411 [Mycena capillaripes]|nr:hypothetical protein B0H19DRAFT_1270411 [Mycena capillaripes]